MKKINDNNQKYFIGFEEIDSNFIKFPKQWTTIMASIDNLAELKVIEYIVRHTWGYDGVENYTKKITIDEFVNGRRKKDRSRIDIGTGLTAKSVKIGIKKAIEHGYIQMDVDEKDKARIKRYFTLYTQKERLIERIFPNIFTIVNFCIQTIISKRNDSEEFELTSQKGEKSEGYMIPLCGIHDTPRSGIETINRNFNSNNPNYSNTNALKNKIPKNSEKNNVYQNFQKAHVVIVQERPKSNLTSMADILKNSYKIPVPERKDIIGQDKTTKTMDMKENNYSNIQKASPALFGFTKHLSMEFGDISHIASNIQQMKNILKIAKSRGVNEESFIDFAFGIKGLVKENLHNIRSSKMGYYFKALKINLKIN